MSDFRDLFKKAPPASTAPFVAAPADGEGTAYGRAALAREADAVAHATEGTRNDTLNRAVYSLSQLIAGGQLSETVVHDTLQAAARACGLDEVEIQATLRSGYHAGVQAPRAPAPLDPIPGVRVIDRSTLDATTVGAYVSTGEGPEAESIEDIVRRRLPLLDWHALWDADDDEEEWILEPLLPARRLVALYSLPKIGKSLLMLELAAAIAGGRPVLGTVLARAHRTLYVDYENDPKADIRTRLQAMGYGPDDLENLCYLSFPVLGALDSAVGAAELMAAVETYKCDVVVIDTVSRAVAGDENENDTWLAFYRHTGLAMKQAGIALIRLDHSGKDLSRGQRGGSAKSGDVDAVWKLSKVDEDHLQLECEAHRMPVLETTLLLTRNLVPHLSHTVATASAHRTKVDAIIAILDAAGAPLDIGRNKARELVAGRVPCGRNGDPKSPLTVALEQRKAAANVTLLPDPKDPR